MDGCAYANTHTTSRSYSWPHCLHCAGYSVVLYYLLVAMPLRYLVILLRPWQVGVRHTGPLDILLECILLHCTTVVYSIVVHSVVMVGVVQSTAISVDVIWSWTCIIASLEVAQCLCHMSCSSTFSNTHFGVLVQASIGSILVRDRQTMCLRATNCRDVTSSIFATSWI